MMRALYAGVSGLKNHVIRQDVIGNNIANVNTVGFKGSRVAFQDMLSQTMSSASAAQGNRGGTNPKQVGLGVGVASIDTIFTDGSVQSTGKNTDLCLSGNGFFVIADGNNTYYTRSGNFEFDTDGNYIIPGSGMKVQGWVADADGKINTAGAVTGVVVPAGQTMAATATTSAAFSKNLSAEATTGSVTTKTTTVTADTHAAAGPTTDTIITVGSGVKINTTTTYNGTNKTVVVETIYPDYANYVTSHGGVEPVIGTDDVTAFSKITTSTTSAQIKAYDSQGTEHLVDVTFAKTGDNTWTVFPGTHDSTGLAISGGTGTVEFNTDGSLKTSTVTDITFAPAQATAVTIKLDMSALTQYAGESTATVTKSDGNAAGTLDNVSFNDSGVVIGTFSNGLKKNLAQVALATFNNPTGLEKSGASLYTESKNSGTAQISTAKNGGAGKITAASLEMSNVDLSEQFSDMIVTQRGFQANSKIITVSDEMIETLVNLKR